MMVGLCGAHRTGKTTLARMYAKEAGIEFIETSVSAINKELGFDLSKEHPFAERLSQQKMILDRVDEIYARHSGKKCIVDRTPLDMIAYTMAEAIHERVSPDDQEDFAQYVQKCFDIANKRFGVVVLVQPGIEIKDAEGKAVPNAAYIEHLNTLILGVMCDERLNVPHGYIQRNKTEMEERLYAVDYCVGSVYREAHQQMLRYRQAGINVH
jgi:hypothetical protein